MLKNTISSLLLLLFSAQALAAEPLKVGISPWYFPVAFENKDGKHNGVDVDVVEAIAHHLGTTVLYHNIPREKIGEAVANGTVDIGIGAIEEKSYLRGYDNAKIDSAKIKMVPYYSVPMAFVVRDPKLKVIGDLKNKTVGTLAFFASRTDLAAMNKKGAIGKILGLEHPTVLLGNLEKKHVETIMVTLPTALDLAEKSKNSLYVVKFTDSKTALREPLALIKSSATDAKTKKISDAVESFVKSKEIDKIAKKWLEVP
jgi:ABC-type amino acid transport substrate-binding protein